MTICKTMLMAGALLFTLHGFAETKWEKSLIQNGDFALGNTTAEGWNAGFFDGAKGTVERVSGGDEAHPNALVLKFDANPKGLIQVESRPFKLPTDGPRRFRLVTDHNGGGLVQIRFYSVEPGKGFTWIKREDGSPVKLEQVLKPGQEWTQSVSEWTLSKERLAQNLYANVIVMFWASKAELKVSSIQLQFEENAAPAPEAK